MITPMDDSVASNQPKPLTNYNTYSSHTALREAIKRDGVEEKTVEQGAATSVWAATAPELTHHGGSYLADCQIAKPVTSEDPRNGHAPWAYDVEGAKRLFLVSETLTRVCFP